MNYFDVNIWMQEVPNEISLVFSIVGCDVGCEGCSWDPIKGDQGQELTLEIYENYIKEDGRFITCVLFMGGEWEPKTLIKYLKIAKKCGLKTCLYSGRCGTIETITQHLDYLKEGPWISSLGGLDSSKTNQRFYKMPSRENLTHLFQKETA